MTSSSVGLQEHFSRGLFTSGLCLSVFAIPWCRVILEPVEESRLRMDAGTWGTMGVGLGCAVGAAATRPDRLVVAVEGDSAFGFSGMEIETIVRYKQCLGKYQHLV